MSPSSWNSLVRVGITFALVLTFFLAVLTVKAFKEYNFIGYDPTDKNTIVVHGEGEVFAVPDTAVFSFTVTEEAKTVAEAQAEATATMNAALAAVKEAGIEEKDYKTIGYNVYPKYEYTGRGVICTPEGYCPPAGRQVIVGYEVSHTIEVKVRESAKSGDLLTAVGASGVQNVSSLDFRVDDQKKLEQDARSLAIADAREKAEKLADELGVRIVKVAGYSESGMYPYYKVANGMGGAVAMDMAQSESVPLPQGENKIMSNVDVTFEIL